jgi:3-hydroxyisobutyrate dehydrogenase-like beta-hydroxyacid dehydrogenase
MNVALAEVFTMGIKAGVEPLDLWEAVPQGATGRVRTFDRLGKFLSGTYDPADFALRLLHKDVFFAVGLGKEVGVPMRLANLALEELTQPGRHADCRSSSRSSGRSRCGTLASPRAYRHGHQIARQVRVRRYAYP